MRIENFMQQNDDKKAQGQKNVKRQKAIFMISFLALPIINFLIFYVYVNFSSITMAFQKTVYQDGQLVDVWTLDNFKMVFDQFFKDTSGGLPRATLNTLMIYAVGTFFIFPISLLMCYFIYKKIVGYRSFRFIAYLPHIITSAALVALFKYTVGKGGPLDAAATALGKTWVNPFTDETQAFTWILVYQIIFGFGGNLVVLGGAFQGINAEVLESGQLDGCNWFQELIFLIVPMIWPTISTMMILGLAGILGSTGPILAFTKGNYNTATLSFKIYEQVAGVNGMSNLNYASAIGIIMTVVTFPLVMLVRHLMYSDKKEENS